MRQFRRGRIFLVLVAVACGRQTFDLLPTDSGTLEPEAGGGDDGAGTGSGGASDPAAGETHGESGRDGGGMGGEPTPPPPTGGAFNTAGSAGTAGASGTAGSGGSSASGGSAGEPDWVGNGGAPDGRCDGHPMRGECRPSATSCIRCNPEQEDPHRDCAGTELPFCDPFDRHCVECLPSYGPEPSTCPPGEGCYPLTMTCQPLCVDSMGLEPPCPQDAPVCRSVDQKPSLCLECLYSTDCAGRGDARSCALGLCVECIDNRGCEWDPYEPTCVNSRCQACREDCDCGPFERCDRGTGACLPAP
jgi:hypothetical protein